MSISSIEFLENSFLFASKHVENEYASFSDDDIRTELDRYRDYVSANLQNTINKIDRENLHINTVIDSFGTLPDAETYKQMALYMNQVVVPDALFEFALKEKPDKNNPINSFMGLPNNPDIDRRELIRKINSLKYTSMLIKSGFVLTLPLAMIHEKGDSIPFIASKNWFSDVLPKDLMDLYRSSACVYNVMRRDGSLIVNIKEALTLGTTICISFEDDIRAGNCFQYTNVEIIEDDGNGHIVIRNTIPDAIDKDSLIYGLISLLTKPQQIIFARGRQN